MTEHRFGSTAYGEVPRSREEGEKHDAVQPPAPQGFVAKVMNLRPVRAYQRFSKANGNMLAGGIAYTAIFSLVAALTIAWSIFMATLGGNPTLRQDVIEGVNAALPGILDDGSGNGIVNPDDLVLESAVNPASIIAALVLLWTAVSLMTNIRKAVQAQFGIVAPAENFVVQKLRDLLGFLLLAVGIVLSTTISTVAVTAGETVTQAIGLGGNPVISFLLRALGFLLAVFVSALQFIQLFRLTSAVRPFKKDLWLGAVVGGFVIIIVLQLGTTLVSSVSDDPLLAASAGLATLLLWINLLSRILLVIAAFTANPPAPEMPKSSEEVHFKETPNFVTMSAPRTLAWEHQDVTGQIDPQEELRPDDVQAKLDEKQAKQEEKNRAMNDEHDRTPQDEGGAYSVGSVDDRDK